MAVRGKGCDGCGESCQSGDRKSKQSVTAAISRLFVSVHISSSAPVRDPSGESVPNKA